MKKTAKKTSKKTAAKKTPRKTADTRTTTRTAEKGSKRERGSAAKPRNAARKVATRFVVYCAGS